MNANPAMAAMCATPREQREQYVVRVRAEAVELYNVLVPLDLEDAEVHLRKHPPSLGALAFLPFIKEEYTKGKHQREFINVQHAGVRARQQSAKAKQDTLEKAIAPLVAQGWSNERIAKKLTSDKLSPYSPASTERHVKKIAAKLRKA